MVVAWSKAAPWASPGSDCGAAGVLSAAVDEREYTAVVASCPCATGTYGSGTKSFIHEITSVVVIDDIEFGDPQGCAYAMPLAKEFTSIYLFYYSMKTQRSNLTQNTLERRTNARNVTIPNTPRRLIYLDIRLQYFPRLYGLSAKVTFYNSK